MFVDANGAYRVQQALEFANEFAEQRVGWFEEPVSSDDLRDCGRCDNGRRPAWRLPRANMPTPWTMFARCWRRGAVDVQQADITRCGGVTAFLQIAALCEAFHIDLSAHCAPSLHLHVACATPRLRHLEWFHDHVRIEQMLFDGAPIAVDGEIRPDPSRPGNGLRFKHQDAARYAVSGYA